MAAQALLWTAIALVAYAYAGFPLLLVIRGLWRKPVRKAPYTPKISVIIIAYNEEKVIDDKLSNLLSLDYPHDALEILVGSDGSDDRTHEIVRQYQDRGVRLLVSPRQGKIATLNATVQAATGDILVFSDANSMFAPGSLRAITQCFADENVGAVAGDQRYDSDSGNAASLGERVFWSFDRFLKVMQSRAGSATSSTGAIHAVRAGLFQPLPSGACDDFVISVRAVAQGYRLVFEPDAIAYEEVAPTDRAEFRRKTRVIARGMRGLWEMRQLLNPLKYGFYSLQLASHKLARWSVIFALPIIFGLTCLLSSVADIYRWLLLAQLVFYAGALLTFALRRTPLFRLPMLKPLAIPYFFCLANFAALVGWLDFFAGRRVDVWNSKRSTPSTSSVSV